MSRTAIISKLFKVNEMLGHVFSELQVYSNYTVARMQLLACMLLLIGK